VWDITSAPALTRTTERVLDPVIGKSLVVYLKKPATEAVMAELSAFRRDRASSLGRSA
jgi:hypothetical protein